MSNFGGNAAQHVWVSGDELKELLQQQIRLHTDGTVSELSELDGRHTISKLHNLIRSVEELINVELAAAGKADVYSLLDVQLDRRVDVGSYRTFQDVLARHYEEAVCQRVVELFSRVSSLRASLLLNQADVDGRFSNLSTPRDLASYLKSRRRHLNTLMYAVSAASTGARRLGDEDLFRVAFHLVDRSLMSLTGMHQKLLMAELFDDYGCWNTGHGLLDGSDHWQELLDGNYLEAERVSITDLPLQPTALPGFDRRKVISVGELRVMLFQIEESYREFDVAAKGLSDLTFFIEELLSYAKDDYFIRVPRDAYEAIADRYKQGSWLPSAVHQPRPGHPLLGSLCPLVRVGDMYESDLFLLLRFAYDMRARVLERNRRYQIRSGFIFEERVKKELVSLGFEVLKIKRIQGKEFDVVAKRDATIHNFQCKNVRLDYQQIETGMGAFVRHNKRIVRYFERALRKEERRESLLIGETGLDKVCHYVISRFPVFSSNPRILSMRDLAQALAET